MARSLLVLAEEIIDRVSGNQGKPVLDAATQRELLKKLNAAIDAYRAYLAIEEAAEYSEVARGLLAQAATIWHAKEIQLRACFAAISWNAALKA